ncbi:MAG: tetratricopeptide repeat protein [Elusimicrobiota bacterium]
MGKIIHWRLGCLVFSGVALAASWRLVCAQDGAKSKDLGGLFLDLSKIKLGTINSDSEEKQYLTTIKLEEARITRSALAIVYGNAYDLYKSGDYSGAQALTAEILSIDPYYSDAFMLQKAAFELKGSPRPIFSQHQLTEDRFEEGMTLYRQGRLVEAEQKWNEVVKLSPWNFKAKYWLNRVHGDLADQHFRRGQKAYRQRRLQESLDQWYAALVLKPDYPGLVGDIAKAESQLREEKANEKLQDALNLYAQGRTEDALKEIDQVLQYGPVDEKARKLMAELRSEMSQQHASLGREFYDSGRYAEAIDEWKKAEGYGYNPALAAQLIARAHDGIRQKALAQADAEKLKKENIMRAKEEAKKKADEDAAAKAKAAQEASQNQQQPSQQAASSPPAASSAPQLGQTSGESRHASEQHYISGMIYYNEGNYEKARQEFSVAKQLDPSNSDAEVGLERIEKMYGQSP